MYLAAGHLAVAAGHLAAGHLAVAACAWRPGVRHGRAAPSAVIASADVIALEFIPRRLAARDPGMLAVRHGTLAVRQGRAGRDGHRRMRPLVCVAGLVRAARETARPAARSLLLAAALVIVAAMPTLAASPAVATSAGPSGPSLAPAATTPASTAPASGEPGASTRPAASSAAPSSGNLAASSAAPSSGAPAASAAPNIATGDTRSSGTPPSFIGQPILAAVAVVVLGLLTAAATVLYTRATQHR